MKYDWCSGSTVYEPDEIPAAYREMHEALLHTRRPILPSLCDYGGADV